MKKFLLPVMLLLAVNAAGQIRRPSTLKMKGDSAVTRQDSGSPSRRDMLKELDLTKEQRQRMKVLRNEAETKKQEIDNDNTLSDIERKQRLRSLRMAQQDSISRVLTPEQFEKFKAMRKEALRNGTATKTE